MQKIAPCLWFDGNIEEAIELYKSVFKNVTVDAVMPGPDGKAFWAEFEIEGQKFKALNGGPEFKFNEAVSFFVTCDTQEEVDRYWDMLTADGGEESMCGWLKDKFGLSWQIIPQAMMDMMSDPDREASDRATQAMLKMKKLDIETLRNAFEGK
jgi:predicted 3-demethylubiquinone-9 3-methyltransferase (glyoxalase superfamily)